MQNNLIVGLAGHIDHGKTSLIKALNGFDGDQREDEKERGITLDISFSNLKLSLGAEDKNISFIDVPGHEKLIKNMIAGAFGIDIVLLVIACDDGIMPQTLEHIHIADMLGVKQAICVITKIDLFPKNSDFEELKEQIKQMFSKLKNTKLTSIITFSIYDKTTHTHLLNLLKDIKSPKKEDLSLFRYYVDRVFSIAGAGKVVTGTVLSGNVQKEEKIYICDLGTEAIIKTIKNHDTPLETAQTGQRIALNLRSKENLKRGHLLSKKGYLRGFDEFDVIIYQLCDIPTNAQFFIGSKKCNAKIQLLDSTNKEKHFCFATIKTDEKIFSIFGEKFILRSSEKTIGGGEILCPISDPMKKKQKLLYLDGVFNKDFKNAFILCSLIHKKGFGLISSTQRFNLTHPEAIEIAKSLPDDFFVDEKDLIIYHPQTSKTLKDEILKITTKNKNALLSASSVAIKLKWASSAFIQNTLNKLTEEKLLHKKEGFYLNPSNNIKNISEYLQETLYKTISSQGFSPLAPYDIYDSLDIDRKSGDDALKALSKTQKIIRLQHNLFINSDTLSEIQAKLREIIKQDGYVDIATLKEKLPLSRKYLIAYLDYLDKFEDIINTDGKRTLKYRGEK